MFKLFTCSNRSNVPIQMRAADSARKMKTKELLSGLGNQEGDWRKMQRKRKHMK